MERWFGRVALVTGASLGIGAEICRELVKYGIKVVACARSFEKIEALAEEPAVKSTSGSILAIRCDLEQEPQILEMFEKIYSEFGRLDICINNAAVCHRGYLHTGETEQWMSMLKVNVVGLCICCRESLRLMRESNIEDGQIINISSMGGHRVPPMPTGIHFYCGTKFMVNALTEGLRRELRALKSRIRVSCISPGAVDTLFFHNLLSDVEKSIALYSSNKVLQAQDISAAVIYILSSPPHVDVNDILVRPTDQVF